MKDLEIKISKSTRMVDLERYSIGNDGESLQEKLIFIFKDEFVNGQARLEYEYNGESNYIVLDKENETYTMPIKNILTKVGEINMQLVIDEPGTFPNVPIFKSNEFTLYCRKSINAVNEAPEGYELWIEKANAKLNEVDEALDRLKDITFQIQNGDLILTIEEGDE